MSAQIRGHRSYGAYANGGQLVFITPATSYSSLTASSVALGVYTMAAGYDLLPGYTAVSSYANTYRIVTAGIIVRNVAPALTAQGYIIVTRGGSGMFPALSGTKSEGNVYGTESATHALSAGMEIPIIFRPVGTAARSFRDLGTGSTAQPDGGFDVISLELVGCPTSGTSIDIEFVYNIKFTLTSANEGLAQLLPVSSPTHPLVATVANKASLALGDLAYNGLKAFGAAALRKISGYLSASPDPRSKVGAAALALMVD